MKKLWLALVMSVLIIAGCANSSTKDSASIKTESLSILKEMAQVKSGVQELTTEVSTKAEGGVKLNQTGKSEVNEKKLSHSVFDMKVTNGSESSALKIEMYGDGKTAYAKQENGGNASNWQKLESLSVNTIFPSETATFLEKLNDKVTYKQENEKYVVVYASDSMTASELSSLIGDIPFADATILGRFLQNAKVEFKYVLDTKTKKIESLSASIDGELGTLKLNTNYSKLGEAIEIVIPEEVIKEANGGE